MLFVRVLKEMQKRGEQCVVPTVQNPEYVKEVAWLNLKSNYVQRAAEERRLPKAGDIAPWKPRSSYIQDYLSLVWGRDVSTGLRFGSLPHAPRKS